MPPKISVVLPTYKRPRYLRLALTSVLAQTERDLEVLVCDNAAQPETREVVEAAGDPRVLYVPRSRNRGLAANALDGFSQASGRLVMKLDDDDLLHPDCLEVLAAPFDECHRLAVSCSDFDLVDPHGLPLPGDHLRMARWTGRDRAPEGYHRPFTGLAARGAVSLVSALIRRDAVDWAAVPREVGGAYDLFVCLAAAEDAGWAHYSRRRLVDYRIHGSSDTVRNLIEQQTGALRVFEHALARGRHTDVEVLEAMTAAVALGLGREMVRAGRGPEARRPLQRAVALRPSTCALSLLAVATAPPAVQRTAIRVKGLGKTLRPVTLFRATEMGSVADATNGQVRGQK